MATFVTPEPISIDLDVLVGNAHLIATARGDTVVVVNPTDSSRKLDIEAARNTQIDISNGRLVVKTPRPRGIGNLVGMGKYGSVQITVELPQGSELEAKTSLGDVRVDGRLAATHVRSGAGDVVLDETGPLKVKSGAGAVSVNRAVGNAEITTAGEMHLGAIDGRAQITNQSGNTWIAEVAGPLRVKSHNGDITVGRMEADVAAKTAFGSVLLGEVANGSVSVESAFGGLEVAIREGTAAWVDAKTSFGKVHNRLGSADGPELSEKTVEIQARTSFGDIVIRRA
ncbi:MAG TPA: DUF4097 family beta strand repeat-containing protein [Acidimicrobiia bacterium]